VRGQQPAITDLEGARQVLRDVEAIPGHPVTKLAMRLLALTVVRPGTLATTPWTELSGLAEQDPTWTIPAERMKLRLDQKRREERDHLVPLPRQAIEAIAALRQLSGDSPYVFPNVRGFHRPMSENALGYMLNRAGYFGRHVPHGWRSTFSTVMNTRRRGDGDVIELMLAHVKKDRVKAAYDRAAHMDVRREIAQEWADLLMAGLPPAASLLTGRRK
jgi:integrase